VGLIGSTCTALPGAPVALEPVLPLPPSPLSLVAAEGDGDTRVASAEARLESSSGKLSAID
jgi:hypothetical protein